VNETKLKGMLGLALRARQASLGMDACRILIRSGKCGIMLLDGETGPNSRKKAQDMCSQAGVPVMILPAGMIAEATGKDNMAIGISKGSFADRIRGELTEDAEA